MVNEEIDFDIDKALKETLEEENIDKKIVKITGNDKQLSIKIPKEYKEIMQITNIDRFEFQLITQEDGKRELKGILIKNG